MAAPVDAGLYALDTTRMAWLTTYAPASASTPVSSSPAATTPTVAAPSATKGRGPGSSSAAISATQSPAVAATSSPAQDSSSSGSKTPIIIGAGVGALVLVLAAVGTVVVRKKRRANDYHFSSDRPDDDDTPMLERKSHPAFNIAKRVLASSAAAGAVSSQTPRRFDMLEDEESVWSRQTSQRSQQSRRMASASSGHSIASFVGGLMSSKRRRVSQDDGYDGNRTPRLYTDRDLAESYAEGGPEQRNQRPAFFSPTSLYGSSFSPLGSSAGGVLAGSTSPKQSQYRGIKRGDTWWSRFTAGTAEMLSPTADVAIRDPAPAPYHDPYDVSQDSSKRNTFGLVGSVSSSTFATTVLSGGQLKSIDEQGHAALEPSWNGSIASSAATSVLMEERMRNMQVSQRLRTTSTHPSSGSNPFADSMATTTDLGDRTPGSIVFDGQAFGDLEADTSEETPLFDQDEFPRSPVKGHRRQPTVGETGVRAMIDEFERRSAYDDVSPPMPSEAVFLPQSPRKAQGRSHAIEHGLVRKPQLFVVN